MHVSLSLSLSLSLSIVESIVIFFVKRILIAVIYSIYLYLG